MTSNSLSAVKQRRTRRNERAFEILWDRVFGIAHFAFEELSREDRDSFGPENEKLKKAAERWLDKLYSRPEAAEVQR